MKVSIITCTLNSGKYIEECLNSVAKQKYKNFEVIIVDGGSTDNTLNIVSKFPFAVVYENIKGGISRAMNFGISKVSGEIISILHSDDYYYSNDILDTVVTAFYNNPNKFWIYGNIARKTDEHLIHTRVPYSFSLTKLLKRNFIPHPSVFVRKEIYVEVGHFNEKYKVAMDYDLILRMAKKFEPVYIDKFFSVFRIHENSTSHKQYLKGQIENLKISFRNSNNLVYVFYGFKNIIQYLIKNEFKRR